MAICLATLAGCTTLAGQWPVMMREAEALVVTTPFAAAVGVIVAFPLAVEGASILEYWLDRDHNSTGPPPGNPGVKELLCAPADGPCARISSNTYSLNLPPAVTPAKTTP